MRVLVAVAFLLMLAFAGCTDKGGGKSSSDTSSSASSSVSASGSLSASSSQSGTGKPGNHAPAGSLSASLNGTKATLALTGTDADGDALSWTLAFGDGSTQEKGTTLPANVTHTYMPGNFSANLTLSDGKTTTVYRANLTVTSGGGSTGGVVQTITGSWDLGNAQTCGSLYANPYHPANQATNEVLQLIADVDAASIGHTFTATFGPAGTGQQSVHLWFSSESTIILDSFSGPGPLTGQVPADATKVSFATCGPQGNSVTYTA